MGNMQIESGFSPLNWQNELPDDLFCPEYIQLYADGINTSGGWGLVQWTYSSRKKEDYMTTRSVKAMYHTLEIWIPNWSIWYMN